MRREEHCASDTPVHACGQSTDGDPAKPFFVVLVGALQVAAVQPVARRGDGNRDQPPYDRKVAVEGGPQLYGNDRADEQRKQDSGNRLAVELRYPAGKYLAGRIHSPCAVRRYGELTGVGGRLGGFSAHSWPLRRAPIIAAGRALRREK